MGDDKESLEKEDELCEEIGEKINSDALKKFFGNAPVKPKSRQTTPEADYHSGETPKYTPQQDTAK